ncbi:MAG: hypothetical protein CME62_16900 [Halobacteriovoraceae bacterium]|nr:hypothetical protein [Halobacteriovoraceae bacterium]
MKLILALLCLAAFNQPAYAMKKLVECNTNVTADECYCDKNVKDLVYHNNEKYCVPKCNGELERLGLECVSPCKADERRNAQNLCISCGGSREWVGDRCLSKCANNQKRNDQGICVSVCSGRFEEVNGRCMPKCPKNNERINGNCKPICPPGHNRNRAGNCQAARDCRSNQEIYNNQCVRKCSAKESRDWDTGKCVRSGCNPGHQKVAGKCVPACPPGQERINAPNKSKFMCFNKCPVNFKRNTEGVCVYCQQ